MNVVQILNQKHFTVAETASIFNITRQQVYKIVKSGNSPHIGLLPDGTICRSDILYEYYHRWFASHPQMRSERIISEYYRIQYTGEPMAHIGFIGTLMDERPELPSLILLEYISILSEMVRGFCMAGADMDENREMRYLSDVRAWVTATYRQTGDGRIAQIERYLDKLSRHPLHTIAGLVDYRTTTQGQVIEVLNDHPVLMQSWVRLALEVIQSHVCEVGVERVADLNRTLIRAMYYLDGGVADERV